MTKTTRDVNSLTFISEYNPKEMHKYRTLAVKREAELAGCIEQCNDSMASKEEALKQFESERQIQSQNNNVTYRPIHNGDTVFMLVDEQHTFRQPTDYHAQTGNLPVPGTGGASQHSHNVITAIANGIVREVNPITSVVSSKDYHSPGHVSYASTWGVKPHSKLLFDTYGNVCFFYKKQWYRVPRQDAIRHGGIGAIVLNDTGVDLGEIFFDYDENDIGKLRAIKVISNSVVTNLQLNEHMLEPYKIDKPTKPHEGLKNSYDTVWPDHAQQASSQSQYPLEIALFLNFINGGFRQAGSSLTHVWSTSLANEVESAAIIQKLLLEGNIVMEGTIVGETLNYTANENIRGVFSHIEDAILKKYMGEDLYIELISVLQNKDAIKVVETIKGTDVNKEEYSMVNSVNYQGDSYTDILQPLYQGGVPQFFQKLHIELGGLAEDVCVKHSYNAIKDKFKPESIQIIESAVAPLLPSSRDAMRNSGFNYDTFQADLHNQPLRTEQAHQQVALN